MALQLKMEMDMAKMSTNGTDVSISHPNTMAKNVFKFSSVKHELQHLVSVLVLGIGPARRAKECDATQVPFQPPITTFVKLNASTSTPQHFL